MTFIFRVKQSSLLQNIQNCFWTHPAFYSSGTGVFPPRVNPPGHEADNSFPFSAQVNTRVYTSIPHMISWCVPALQLNVMTDEASQLGSFINSQILLEQFTRMYKSAAAATIAVAFTFI
jgi:hypothetical protein